MEEIIKCRKGDIIGKIWRVVLLCTVMILLMIPNKQMEKSIFSSLLDIVYPKMEVQAGTIDANGHTAATDLSGNAHSMLTDDGTLYIFRTAGSIASGSSYTYIKNGKSYSGTVQVMIKNLSNSPTDHPAIVTSGNKKAVKKVVFLDDLKPAGGSVTFSGLSNLQSIEGVNLPTTLKGRSLQLAREVQA